MTLDLGDQPLAGDPASRVAWDHAWEQLLHFRGDPIAALATANEHDDAFVMGPVFAATYIVLAGSPLDASELTTHVERARSRCSGAPAREVAHVEALDRLVAGEFTRAAHRWDETARQGPDFAAVRFAHDVYLHVGDATGRLASSRAAVDDWVDRPGADFIAGQYAFALEEIGCYDEAEQVGRRALEADPDDLWARHALAHVYESVADNEAAFELLRDTSDRWQDQELLATHMWWHLALRLLAVGDVDAVLAIFDERLPSVTTPFRLCDQTSLLWRVELAGHVVGDRWDDLADRWDTVVERHVCGFLDLHAALTFVRRPEHPGAYRWFDGLAHLEWGDSENDRTFAGVVVPLVDALRAYRAGDPGRFVAVVDRLGSAISRIGGSVAQRDLISLIRRAAETTT